MSSNPTDIAWLGHRLGCFLQNTGGTNDVWVDRVQEADSTLTIPTENYFELGNVSQIGITQAPAEYRFVLRQNLHNNELDSILAGGSGSPVAAFNVGDMVANTAIRANIVARATGATNPSYEWQYANNTIGELSYEFVINAACTTSCTLQGRAGTFYTSGSLIHTSWGVLDSTSPGGVNGKDMRVFFSSTSTGRIYRVQRLMSRTTFPVQTVKELGDRTIKGLLADTPTTTVEFDLLPADYQPIDVLFSIVGTGYDLGQPVLTNMYGILYDPTAAEAATPIKYFKWENVQVTGGTPIRGQVRALATMRYTLNVTKATTANSGGLIVSPSIIA
jgi:hypothetical protein